jgi:hypothetical protein
MPSLAQLRHEYHVALSSDLLGVRATADGRLRSQRVGAHEYPLFTNADSHNDVSVLLAAGVAERLSVPLVGFSTGGSTSGSRFERHTRAFVEEALLLFAGLQRRRLVTLPGRVISSYAQFAHLREIQRLIRDIPELQAALGGDYLVDPDILVAFEPFSEADLNEAGANMPDHLARLSPVRAANSQLQILHASISCKWTMRRDRAQNTRLEALNLVRNRKGRLPHVAAVTMECDPDIIGSLCLGTGDIDCVYHGALPELVAAAEAAATSFDGKWGATVEVLERMINGSRLRDISDLPLDLQV